DNLGNGESIMHQTTIPNVFSKQQYNVNRPDPVPEKFKVTLPTIRQGATTVGQAVLPVLGTGEFEASDEQTTEFWHRAQLQYRPAASLPSSLVNYRMTEEQLSATVIETLDEGAIPTIVGDLSGTTIEAKVENLGLTSAPSTYLTLKTLANTAV